MTGTSDGQPPTNETTMLFPGFIGVSAFTTAICRPSRVGDVLRFRGYDIRTLVGVRAYDDIWRLLVDDDFGSGPLASVSGDVVAALVDADGSPRVILQRLLLRLGEALHMQPTRGAEADGLRDDLAVLSTAYATGLGMLLGVRAGSRGEFISGGDEFGVAQRLVLAWRGDLDAEAVRVVGTTMSTVAEHGTTASTLAARVVASTGADAAACLSAGLGAIGGPRHGGATRGVTAVLRELAADGGSAVPLVERLLDAGRRLPGLGHRVYRDQDPRVSILRGLAESVDAPLLGAALDYEAAAHSVLSARRGDGRRLPGNPDLWLPVILDGIGVPDDFMDALLAGSRIAGWSAHSVEQVRTGGPLLRPDDIYVGHDARRPD